MKWRCIKEYLMLKSFINKIRMIKLNDVITYKMMHYQCSNIFVIIQKINNMIRFSF